MNTKEYRKQYYQKNKDKALKQAKQWRKNNPEYLKNYMKQWRKDNPEYDKQHSKQWRKDNPRKTKQYYLIYKEKYPEYSQEYYKNHKSKIRTKQREYAQYKRKTNLKYSLNHKIKRAICIALKGNKNGKHWENLVGYTLNDLIKRLNKTMPKSYCWQDYLNGDLEIDHIIPISAFNFNKPEDYDFQRCWTLENLRLLPARENLIKHNKLIKPFQPSLKF